MCNFFFHDCNQDIKKTKEDILLAKKPINLLSGKEYEACSYAFLPGCRLCAAEPEIVVKAYDSLRFQNPDTAILIQYCGSLDIKEKWEEMGNPTIVTACMTCLDTLKKNYPAITVISLYEHLQELKISGGCNSENYTIYDPSQSSSDARSAVIELAENMGVTLHEKDSGRFPYLTYCIDCRDSLKNQGKDAVHILELIYGMGNSNTHMIHEHHHDHEKVKDQPEECSGNCTECGLPCGGSSSEPSPLPSESERLTNMKELKDILLQLFWT